MSMPMSSEVLDFLIEYLSLNPSCIFIDKAKARNKDDSSLKYRVRINISAPPLMLEEILKMYGNSKNSKRCEKGVLRLSDRECYAILNQFKNVLGDNPRIPLCLQVLELKAVSLGRGHKKNLQYEAIYQEYLSIKDKK